MKVYVLLFVEYRIPNQNFIEKYFTYGRNALRFSTLYAKYLSASLKEKIFF